MLSITNLKKSYYDNRGVELKVFEDFNLEIHEGEFLSLFGPNGCGKTTLLNLIAELDKSDGGEITFLNKKHKIAFIFQDYRNSLFPWLNIVDNISYPLKLAGSSIIERREQTENMCRQFGAKLNFGAYPYTLSGGQQQLVSILRALIANPDIILLDEPFSSLDYQTTLFMLKKTQEMWQKTKITFIYVSHEIDEAIFLSQRLVLLSNKPTRVVKVVNNALPYPRTTEVAGNLEFSRLKNEALDVFVKQISMSI